MPLTRLLAFCLLPLIGGTAFVESSPPQTQAVDAVVTGAVRRTQAQFPNENLRDDDVAVTVIDLRDPAHPRRGSFRGDQPVYPASVVKLFYLAATHQWLQDGRLRDSEELRRMMRDMVVDSSNDATAAVVDALTGATNGEPLPEGEMKAWAEKRNAVNRYFTSLRYTGINVCQKTYAEGPYGRERVFLGPKFENRNKLTTDTTARLLAEIVRGKAVSRERSGQMMELLKRDLTKKGSDSDDQTQGFIGGVLPPGSRLWSKAGWTSTARHDAAYVEAPDGQKFVVVIFTTGHANRRELLPAIVGEVLKGLRDSTGRE
jgi:beta-lactamase class A